MMEMTFKLEVFEGPLDLLLHLIDINKIDIYDIPISLITDQYMAYIHQMQIEDDFCEPVITIGLALFCTR